MRIIDNVGNTPLFELKNTHLKNGVKIYVKAEYQNPSGSVKDRAARAMILDGIRTGSLTRKKIIIDATSGNTGIAYAMFGAELGYKVLLTMPANVTEERRKIMKAYGAQIIETDPLEGIDGAYRKCRKIVESDPDSYFYPDQYSNEQNWKAHYYGTAEEIFRQTDGQITHFVAGTGTSGTFIGTSRRLKEICSSIRCYAMTPDSPFHGIEGVKHNSALHHSGFYDESVADGIIEISTEEAYDITRKLAVNEGVFAGISSGANVGAALKLAETVPENSRIVTILCDGGYRYLSGSVWG